MIRIIRIFAILLTILSVFISSAQAGYIKFGTALSKTDNMKGSIGNLDFGLYSFGKLSLGIGLEQAFYGENFYGNMSKIIKIAKSVSDTTELYNATVNNKFLSSYTSGFFNLTYNFTGKRGAYAFAGVGYGIKVKLRDEVSSLVYIASAIDKNQNPEELLNDPEFNKIINDLSKDPTYMINLINTLMPGNEDLVSMIDTEEEIYNLAQDQEALNSFISSASKAYDESSVAKASLDTLCNVAVYCNYKIAYQIGVGYDIPIWGIFGLDMYTKIKFMPTTDPVYAMGANFMFKW